MYIFIHLYDICNICYLLFMSWYALVLFLSLKIIRWTFGCSTPPFISFSSGVNAIGGLQSGILLCNSIRLCICTLDLVNARVELCYSFLSINLILDMKSNVLHFIRVALYGHVSRPSVRSLSFVTKLKKFLYSFDVCLVLYSGCVTHWALYSNMWPLSCWNM